MDFCFPIWNRSQWICLPQHRYILLYFWLDGPVDRIRSPPRWKNPNRRFGLERLLDWPLDLRCLTSTTGSYRWLLGHGLRHALTCRPQGRMRHLRTRDFTARPQFGQRDSIDCTQWPSKTQVSALGTVSSQSKPPSLGVEFSEENQQSDIFFLHASVFMRNSPPHQNLKKSRSISCHCPTI